MLPRGLHGGSAVCGCMFHQFPICGGNSPDLLAYPDLEHPRYCRECTVHNLPVYSIELLKCQYPSRGQFFPCEVFMRVIHNATSHVGRHFLFSCSHADCLEGECLLLGEIVRVLAEEYSLCAKICRAVQLRCFQSPLCHPGERGRVRKCDQTSWPSSV